MITAQMEELKSQNHNNVRTQSNRTKYQGCLVLFIFLLSITPNHLSAKPDKKEAARFLNQATLGYTEAQIKNLQETGYKKWIKQQTAEPPTLLQPYIESLFSRRKIDHETPRNSLPYHKVNSKGNNVGYRNLSTAWMRSVLKGDDHLRQRVAWALSQIIVTSSNNNRLTMGTSNYYDVLLKHAFSSYEDLLLTITFHPVMGRYLSYMGNKKANAKINRQPDENYAREILQLFTIGLWELNPDGSYHLNASGKPIPTYTNSDITELARVFTGFWISNALFDRNDWDKYDRPMSIAKRYHDRGSKNILDGHIQVSPGMDPEKEIATVVTSLARHPNVAPFMSRRLINHLVTSNPSKHYMKRVSKVWLATNGNLGAVIQAILLDPEARSPAQGQRPFTGRLKDPIQRLTNILIGFECGAELGKEPDDYPGLQWWRPEPLKHLSQAPMQAPSVFNFFEPQYSEPGPIADAGLFSPEFQILNDATASTVPNYIWRGLLNGFHTPANTAQGSALRCNFDKTHQLSLSDTLGKANLLLAAGSIESNQLIAIENLIKTQAANNEEAAVFAIAISPNATIQQ